MGYLDASIDNPFFAGYAHECDSMLEFKSKIDSIVGECGRTIEAPELTERLVREGIDPKKLSSQELEIIDSVFDCFE